MWLEYSVSNNFLMEKGVNSVHGPWTTALVGSPWPPWTKDMAIVGSSPELLVQADSGHGGPTRVGEKEEGATRVQFCLLPRLGRWRTDGGVLALNGDGAGAVEDRRRRVGGVGSFTKARLPFVGRRRSEGPGCLQWPAMKEAFNATGYWEGNEEGGHCLMGEMKRW
jgi:hypothetical protein